MKQFVSTVLGILAPVLLFVADARAGIRRLSDLIGVVPCLHGSYWFSRSVSR